MSELSTLRNRQSAKFGEKRRCEANIADIEEKLVRLRAAKAEMASCKRKVLSGKDAIKSIPENIIRWEGDKKNQYISEMDELAEDLENYYRGVDRALDSLCDAITSLENEKNRQIGILGGILSVINSIGNEIEKLLN